SRRSCATARCWCRSGFSRDSFLRGKGENMSKVPADLKYVKTHEWIKKLPDGNLLIGITDHAQHALGDLVFVEVPKVGRKVAADEACAVVESVKAASDVYAPLAG